MVKLFYSSQDFFAVQGPLKAHSNINCIYVDVYWSCFKIIAFVSSFKILSKLDVNTYWKEAKAWFSFPLSFYKVIRNKKWIHKPKRISTSSIWWKNRTKIDFGWLNKEFLFSLGAYSKTHRYILHLVLFANIFSAHHFIAWKVEILYKLYPNIIKVLLMINYA